MDHIGDNSRSEPQQRRNRRQQLEISEDSSFSNMSQNPNSFGIGTSSQSSHGYYPSFYQYPNYMSYGHHLPVITPSYHHRNHILNPNLLIIKGIMQLLSFLDMSLGK